MDPRHLFPALIAASLACASSGGLRAQTDVTLELGASQIGPPLGIDAQSARFGVAGIRASHYALGGSGLSGSLLVGRTFGDANGGDFASGAIGLTALETWGAGFRGGMDVTLLGFGVGAPFPYRALAAEGGPTLEYRGGPVSVRGSLIGGVGRSWVELVSTSLDRSLVLEDYLWRLGGTAELLLGTGPVRVGVAGGVHDTPAGTYGSGGGRIVVAGRWGAAELRADIWDTPLGSETTGGLVLVIPLAGWSLRGFLGRSEPDPLTLAQPGSGSGGLLVGRRLYTRALGGEAVRAPYEVLASTERGARVRVSIEAPVGARKVELLGDFTLWESVPMQNAGTEWSIELEIEEGTHHYGFLIDDEWHVPDDTEDVVPDEWGRVSAILVIEGVS